MKILSILLTIAFVFSCKPKDTSLTAQQIVDKAIETSCNGKCDHALIDFTFRDRCYVSNRNGSSYKYERITADSTGVTVDIISNNGFSRFKNDTLIKVSDSIASILGNSVNSVHYFSQLPYGLNAPAVIKELLGETTINGEPYYELSVTFNEEGGGTDFEDAFLYWVHKEHYTIDYLAYEYSVNGGGIRFREAFNIRVIEGIRFADYNNYKPESLEYELRELAPMFETGQLKLVSKIETESVGVLLPETN